MILHYSYWNEYFGYAFNASKEELAKKPQWAKHEAFPPLSPRIAIANAKGAVQRTLTEVQPFDPTFRACSLQVRSEYEGGWWYYVVSFFVPDLEDVGSDWSEFSVPVLFDGTTPEPAKFKYEERFDVYREANKR